MDTNERIKRLQAEIDEISQLIKEWKGAADPETKWAIYLLKVCLNHRKRLLKVLQY